MGVDVASPVSFNNAKRRTDQASVSSFKLPGQSAGWETNTQRHQQPGRQTTETIMNVEDRQVKEKPKSHQYCRSKYTNLRSCQTKQWLLQQVSLSNCVEAPGKQQRSGGFFTQLGVFKVISCSVKKLETHLCSCKCSQNALWRCVTLHTALNQTHLERQHTRLRMPSFVLRPVLKYSDFENAFRSYGSGSRWRIQSLWTSRSHIRGRM